MKPRLASRSHSEIMTKECSHGATSADSPIRADSHSAPKRSGPQRTAAAKTRQRAEMFTKALTHAEWNECFKKH